MKIAVCTIAYNEARFIRPCIRQFKPFGLRHLVLVSSKPWNGMGDEYDGTAEIARNEGAEVIVGYWPSEAEQRNWGLARLYDYDWVLIVDPDEFYTQADIGKIIEFLKQWNSPEKTYAVKAGRIITYWKNLDFIFSPEHKNTPYIAINPKLTQFKEFRLIRQFEDKNWEWGGQPSLDATLHHLSWARTDKEVRTKIKSYSHQENIPVDWYEKVWMGWGNVPGMEDMVVDPYGMEKSHAIYSPAPQEIKQLINS